MSELYFISLVSLVISSFRFLYLSYALYTFLFIDITFPLFHISFRVSHALNFFHIDLNIVRCPFVVLSYGIPL
jgi:fumarate reductase subunit D